MRSIFFITLFVLFSNVFSQSDSTVERTNWPTLDSVSNLAVNYVNLSLVYLNFGDNQKVLWYTNRYKTMLKYNFEQGTSIKSDTVCFFYKKPTNLYLSDYDNGTFDGYSGEYETFGNVCTPYVDYVAFKYKSLEDFDVYKSIYVTQLFDADIKFVGKNFVDGTCRNRICSYITIGDVKPLPKVIIFDKKEEEPENKSKTDA